ncbi:unnamed protein product [Pipistrellus nathusii]|uniref:Uncharacterized protein n=1 Tax=Pipistrellus nathusii TaxID=59473 RepID=A0ABP0A7E9_PIPNA
MPLLDPSSCWPPASLWQRLLTLTLTSSGSSPPSTPSPSASRGQMPMGPKMDAQPARKGDGTRDFAWCGRPRGIASCLLKENDGCVYSVAADCAYVHTELKGILCARRYRH